MIYLLDTNACIALVSDRPVSVRARLREAMRRGADIGVPSVAAYELWYGVAKSARPEKNAAVLRAFLAGGVAIFPFDDEDAIAAGEIRATLERRGTPIGAYDVLIAGQAMRRGATLVTANVSEFARIAGLAWEDWAATD